MVDLYQKGADLAAASVNIDFHHSLWLRFAAVLYAPPVEQVALWTGMAREAEEWTERHGRTQRLLPLLRLQLSNSEIAKYTGLGLEQRLDFARSAACSDPARPQWVSGWNAWVT
jgi:hypothetical protein